MELFVDGESIFSTEGTTQGDPMGMPMYALGVMPLIHKLNTHSITQIWYAEMLVSVALFKISVNGGMICCHVVLIMDTSLIHLNVFYS